MLDTSSPSSNKANSFDPALFEVKIYGQAFSNTFVSLGTDVVLSHQVHRGSVILDIHPISDSLNLSNKLAASSSIGSLRRRTNPPH